MEKALSPRMKTALGVLSRGTQSAYRSGLNLGTLQALEGRGLVRSIHGRGSLFCPRTAVKWQLTDAGRAALTPPTPSARPLEALPVER